MLVHLRDAVVVRFGGRLGLGGIGEVEGVLHLTSWVLLGYEESIEAPESGLDEG